MEPLLPLLFTLHSQLLQGQRLCWCRERVDVDSCVRTDPDSALTVSGILVWYSADSEQDMQKPWVYLHDNKKCIHGHLKPAGMAENPPKLKTALIANERWVAMRSLEDRKMEREKILISVMVISSSYLCCCCVYFSTGCKTWKIHLKQSMENLLSSMLVLLEG